MGVILRLLRPSGELLHQELAVNCDLILSGGDECLLSGLGTLVNVFVNIPLYF